MAVLQTGNGLQLRVSKRWNPEPHNLNELQSPSLPRCSKQPPLKSQCPCQLWKSSEPCKAMYLCFLWHWMCCYLLWQQWQSMTLTSTRSVVIYHRGPSASFPEVPLIYFVFKLLNLFLCIWVSTCTVCPGHVHALCMGNALEGQKRGQIPWNWSCRGLGAIIWVLGIEAGSSARAVRLSEWPVSLDSIYFSYDASNSPKHHYAFICLAVSRLSLLVCVSSMDRALSFDTL